MATTVLMTKTCVAGNGTFHTAGQTYELDDSLARYYMASNSATFVSGGPVNEIAVTATTNPVTGRNEFSSGSDTIDMPGFSEPIMGIVGDSRFAGSINRATVPFSTSQIGFVGMALALSGRCVRVPDTAWKCVGGQRVTTGTATADTAPFSVQISNLLAAGIKNITLLGGLNDYELTVGPVQSVEAVVAEYRAQITRMLNAGCRLWVCSDPGVRTAEAASSSKARHVAVLRQNEWVRTLAYYYPDRVAVVDLHGALVEAASATASPPTAWYQDASHYNVIGNYYGAKELARVWNLTFDPAPILPRSNGNNHTYDNTIFNKLDNSLFLTDTNADGLADGWSYAAATGITAVHSLVSAGSGGVGNAQRTVFTAGQSGYPKMQSSNIASRFADGDWIVFVCRARALSPVSCTAPRGKLLVNGGGSTELEFGNAASLPENASFVIATNPMQKTAAITSVQAEVGLQFTGVGSATLDIEQAGILVLPQF